MKNSITSILAIALVMISTTLWAQDKKDNLNHVDLKELKKSVIKQLLDDELIDSKRERVYLSLRTNTTVLNGKKLTSEQHATVNQLLKDFDIKRGSYRTIYITTQCTAIGDFYVDSFKGKMEGRMKIKGAMPSES